MIDTLTAYKCTFNYLQRNNPLIDIQREAIKENEKPKYSFSEFIDVYIEYTKDLAIGESTKKAISLSDSNVLYTQYGKIKKWDITLNAGKQGQPVTLVKIRTNRRYNYGSDTAALYEHHVFFYESEDGLIAIFHRRNGSGCKSVFLETANKAIKSLGLKLDMDLIAPFVENMNDAKPLKLTMQLKKKKGSSDIADHIDTNTKYYTVRDLGLNLDANENKIISKICKDLLLNKITKDNAFALIKAQIDDSCSYNDAEIKIKIGTRHKKYSLNDFESMMGSFDITNELSNAYKKSKDFIGELNKIADRYYKSVVESEVI